MTARRARALTTASLLALGCAAFAVIWLVRDLGVLRPAAEGSSATRPSMEAGRAAGRPSDDAGGTPSGPEAASAPSSETTSPAAASGTRYIRDQLRLQGVSKRIADELSIERRVILPETEERLNDPLNWLAELRRSSSSIVLHRDGRPTMLQLDHVAPDSLLSELGVRDGDLILLVDQEIPVFDRSHLFGYQRRMRDALSELATGGSISVTLMRDGRPVHIRYQAW